MTISTHLSFTSHASVSKFYEVYIMSGTQITYGTRVWSWRSEITIYIRHHRLLFKQMCKMCSKLVQSQFRKDFHSPKNTYHIINTFTRRSNCRVVTLSHDNKQCIWNENWKVHKFNRWFLWRYALLATFSVSLLKTRLHFYILHGLFFVLWLHFYDNMVAYFYANAVLYRVLILNNKSIKNDVLRFVLFG